MLEDFLELMNTTEGNSHLKAFASSQTNESLRVTLLSALDIKFLHSQGLSYVLTAKLNQDSLEVGFELLVCLRMMTEPANQCFMPYFYPRFIFSKVLWYCAFFWRG